ncbi:T9SS type A sorting domain-containing protein [Chryseobacterium sp. 5_R23647]|uniref:T9SS type A sorting domain-containing protein n=1 Tax=Chryseobacterium sp. 5_R23647 TaxID=2258964 RepID=UPI000E242D44|nr:T9SS type A sorting domain-containing protein [Chryseobacterium sp. 5_R23647]REC45974.1 hypothetical protein DRF69_02360 [Chryseobacterium sp. 5_R23647]
MKTKLFFLLLFSAFLSKAQVLSETFQGTTFPPTGWTTGSTQSTRPWGFTTEIFNATGQATFNITGGKSAAIGWIAGLNDAHLTSPSFSLAGFASASLTFNAKIGYEYMVNPFANGDLKVEVSTNGTTWTQVWVEENYGPYDDYETLNITVNLTPYVGQSSVKIRFRYVANDADSLSIDDVLVTGSNLSTKEVSKSKTSIYPNPTKGEVNIKTDKKIKSTTVLDLSGKVLTIGSSETVNLSAFTKGTYLVKIEFADGSSKTEKIIKD